MSALLDIQIDNYEGPIDLLIHLIHRNEMNIFDVPISDITDHFVSEIRRMRSMDMEVAADFIQMASYLIYLKSRSLLPSAAIQSDELPLEEEEFNFAQLLADLAYCKDLSVILRERAEKSGRSFMRRDGILLPRSELVREEPFALANAFFEAVEEKPEINVVVHSTKARVDAAVARTKAVVGGRNETLWSFLSRIFPESFEQAVAFTTVLDMSRHELLYVIQDGNFTEILIQNLMNKKAEMDGRL